MQLDIDTTAFMAMDFQPSILATLKDPDTVIAAVSKALTITRGAKIKPFFVRVAFTRIELDDFPERSAMGKRMKALGDQVLPDAPATQIDFRLSPKPDEIVLRKRRVGPFSTTSLHERLKESGIETLVIADTHTSGCVLTAAREAFDLDYRVIVLSDACADADDNLHHLLVQHVLPKQATVMNIEEYAGLLGGNSDQAS